jgi:wyosine [tRNA(Phe)-imidazoG37] synthetase (radical SAM superfamily)
METIPKATSCLYGPVASPRLGDVLWVNPLPTKYKLCSFNCLYCRLGPSDKIAADVSPYVADMPTVEQILGELKKTFDEGIDFDTIALSGNGEPTLHPEFGKLVRKINSSVKGRLPGTTLALLSNSSGLLHEDVLETLDLFDLPIFKFDVGKPSSFYRINRPDPDIIYEDIFAQLQKVGPKIHMQTVFVGGPRGNMNDADIKMWTRAAAEIRPKAIEIYSTNRAIPEHGVDVVPTEELEKLAQRVEAEVGVPVVAFGKWV